MSRPVYKDFPLHTTVYLGRRVVGEILKKPTEPGWFYAPKGAGKHSGEVMPTREAVKRSLEADE